MTLDSLSRQLPRDPPNLCKMHATNIKHRLAVPSSRVDPHKTFFHWGFVVIFFSPQLLNATPFTLDLYYVSGTALISLILQWPGSHSTLSATHDIPFQTVGWLDSWCRATRGYFHRCSLPAPVTCSVTWLPPLGVNGSGVSPVARCLSLAACRPPSVARRLPPLPVVRRLSPAARRPLPVDRSMSRPSPDVHRQSPTAAPPAHRSSLVTCRLSPVVGRLPVAPRLARRPSPARRPPPVAVAVACLSPVACRLSSVACLSLLASPLACRLSPVACLSPACRLLSACLGIL